MRRLCPWLWIIWLLHAHVYSHCIFFLLNKIYLQVFQNYCIIITCNLTTFMEKEIYTLLFISKYHTLSRTAFTVPNICDIKLVLYFLHIHYYMLNLRTVWWLVITIQSNLLGKHLIQCFYNNHNCSYIVTDLISRVNG